MVARGRTHLSGKRKGEEGVDNVHASTCVYVYVEVRGVGFRESLSSPEERGRSACTFSHST